MLKPHLFSLAILAVAFTGCASVPAPVSVADTISQNPSLSTLSSLIAQAGLSSTLQSAGSFTVFAPSNDAFNHLSTKTLEDLSKHPDKLKNVLSFHIISGKVAASEVKNSSIKTLNDSNVALSKAGDFVTIENAVVQTSDIQASNGVIHIIDSVLTP